MLQVSPTNPSAQMPNQVGGGGNMSGWQLTNNRPVQTNPYGSGGFIQTPYDPQSAGTYGYHDPNINENASPTNFGAYASNLPTSFDSPYPLLGKGGSWTNYGGSSDQDVNQAQSLQYQLDQAKAGLNPGASQNELQAQLAAVQGRLGQKNQLGQEIGRNQSDLNQQLDNEWRTANSNLDKGIKQTRWNYGARGLLASGGEAGAEHDIRNQVASTYYSNTAADRSDAANALNAEKTGYASVDLAGEQQKIDSANQAFQTVNSNNIARAQAYEQLGRGVGQGVGLIAGMGMGAGGQPSYPQPNAGQITNYQGNQFNWSGNDLPPKPNSNPGWNSDYYWNQPSSNMTA